MRTASFRTYTGVGRVSIARYAPRDTPKGFRIYRPLAPGPWFNSVARPEYERLYAEQLAALNPAQVCDDLQSLAGEHEPVLLCWEKPPFTEANWCHRRLVARWLLDTTGAKVPELIERAKLETLAWKHAPKNKKSTHHGERVVCLSTSRGIETVPLAAYTDAELIESLPRPVVEKLGLE